MKLRSTIRLLILMAVFGFSLSNRVERTKGGHLSFNKKIYAKHYIAKILFIRPQINRC